jgi:AcrR family transcriptional regulator
MPERAGSSTRRGSAEAKESKRQEIAAAADCFERYRVQRVRVEDIAQAAGISGTNFHHFFPSRSALIDAVILARVGAIVDATSPVIEGADFRDAVITGLAHTIELCRRDKLFMELLSLTREKRLGELVGDPSGFGFDMVERLWLPAVRRARGRRAGGKTCRRWRWRNVVRHLRLLCSGRRLLRQDHLLHRLVDRFGRPAR